MSKLSLLEGASNHYRCIGPMVKSGLTRRSSTMHKEWLGGLGTRRFMAPPSCGKRGSCADPLVALPKELLCVGVFLLFDTPYTQLYTKFTMNNEEIILQKLETLEQGFAKHDEQLDFLATKLAEHDAKFETLATKADLAQLREEVLSGQDAMMTILKRLDDERVHEYSERQEMKAKLEEHDVDIGQIKTVLKMA